jgi:hypothetical protein
MFSQSLQQRKRSEEVCLVLGWVMALLRLWFPSSLEDPTTLFSLAFCVFFFFFFFGILQVWACVKFICGLIS